MSDDVAHESSQGEVEGIPSDLAQLYPADSAEWKSMTTVSVQQAVLLSLGIDPHTISDLMQQNLNDAFSEICTQFYTTYPESVEPINYGKQEKDYRIRLSATDNAIAANIISRHQMSDSQYANHVRLDEFIGFAKRKEWTMPGWLSALGEPEVSNPARLSGVRERKKEATRVRNEAWQRRGDELLSENPNWTKTKICETIAREPGGNRNANTIRNNIKISPMCQRHGR